MSQDCSSGSFLQIASKCWLGPKVSPRLPQSDVWHFIDVVDGNSAGVIQLNSYSWPLHVIWASSQHGGRVPRSTSPDLGSYISFPSRSLACSYGSGQNRCISQWEGHQHTTASKVCRMEDLVMYILENLGCSHLCPLVWPLCSVLTFFCK